VIGNFPYNISSQILFHVLEFRDQVPEVIGMLQKEVAQRIASPPGSKDYGILSVLLQAWYDIEFLFTVPPHVFIPPPKVQSAVIRLTRNETKDLGCDYKLFVRVVRTGFNQRRKTLRNALKPLGYPPIETSNDLFNKRAEQLSVQDFITLAKLYQEKQS
jgi:16S rRNA (adenine1518-N6/adenine1519-N6)-dimethyltransferase